MRRDALRRPSAERWFGIVAARDRRPCRRRSADESQRPLRRTQNGRSNGTIGDTEFAGAPPPTSVGHDSDVVGAAGIVVGKYWHPNGVRLRTEVEYLHRFRFDYDYRYGLIVNEAGYENNVSSDSMMLTTLYDFRTGTGVTP
jgi:hypothetical protein